MTVIKLKSSDDRTFEVDVDVAKKSTTIKTMLEDLGAVDGETVPLPNVHSVVLERVIEWATFHKDDRPNEDDDDDDDYKEPRTDDIPPWDQEFLKRVDLAILFELIQAANYLDIKRLLDSTCKTVANMIKGKSVEELRKAYPHAAGGTGPAEQGGGDQAATAKP